MIHVLYMGMAICGFSPKLPHEWPAKHKWIYLYNPMAENATCVACKDERVKLLAYEKSLGLKRIGNNAI